MAELPIMPLKVHMLLADTAHMSTEEFGAYCRLLFTMWLQGAQLPNNPTELAHIVGVSRTRWARMADQVLRPMTKTEQNLSQKRLTDTFLKVRDLRRKRVESANKRWSKRNAHAMQ